MYSVSRQFCKFYSDCSSGKLIYAKIFKADGDEKEAFITLSGHTNFLWQSWCKFWRIYWLVFLRGGIGLKNNLQVAALPTSTARELDSISTFLTVIRGRRIVLNGHHQEPTWGDFDFIKKCAIAANSISPAMLYGSNVLNAFSVIGNTPKHFQIVRNASIHLDRFSMAQVQTDVVPSYLITKIRYPTDILSAEDLGSRKKAINMWLDDLITVITLSVS